MPIHNTLVFDIETVADTAAYRLLHNLPAEQSDADTYRPIICTKSSPFPLSLKTPAA